VFLARRICTGRSDVPSRSVNLLQWSSAESIRLVLDIFRLSFGKIVLERRTHSVSNRPSRGRETKNNPTYKSKIHNDAEPVLINENILRFQVPAKGRRKYKTRFINISDIFRPDRIKCTCKRNLSCACILIHPRRTPHKIFLAVRAPHDDETYGSRYRVPRLVRVASACTRTFRLGS